MELFKISAIEKVSVKAKSNNQEIKICFVDIVADVESKQRIDRNNIKVGDYLHVTFLADGEIDLGVYIPRERVKENHADPSEESNSQRRSKTEPPIPSSPTPQLGPIGLKRQELKHLLLPENVLKALGTKYFSYRYSRLDINSFYRAAGIAVMEYIANSIATREFKEKIYNSMLDARIILKNYWEDDNDTWLAMMGWFIDYDNSITTADKLQFLEQQVYISTAYTYESGLILMIKFLESLWVCKNGLNDENKWYFDSQSPEQFINATIGVGSQPGENDILFFSFSIDAEINIIRVDPSFKVIKNTYNEGKENVLNFIEINETFYPIFSYEQLYYESNPIEKAVLEPYRSLNGGKWPIEIIREKAKSKENSDQSKFEALKATLDLFLKEEEISHFSWQTLGKIKESISSLGIFSDSDTELLDKIIEDKQCQYCCVLKDVITLKCNNKVCQEDLYNSIVQDTGNLIVINNWEKENQNELIAKCPVCKEPLDEQTIELAVGSELYQAKKQESLERERIQVPIKIQCKCCLVEKEEGNFYKYDVADCAHVCLECMLENIRRNQLECPECHIQYSEPFLATIKLWGMRCCFCKEGKNILKGYSGKLCEAHNITCLSCLNLFREWKYCMACGAQFDEDKLKELNKLLEKECTKCGKNYSRLEELESKDCLCNICKSCQCESIDSCIICRKEFEDGIKNILRKAKDDKNEEERLRKLRIRQCVICQETRYITDMRGLDCNHYFCEACLADMLKYYIENRMLEKATCCPHDDCGIQINPHTLQSLLSPELWNKLNVFLISQQFNLVNCPNCKTQFEAPLSRKAICLECKCEFCKACGDLWHEQPNCEETQIQRRIKEMEDAGEVVSQCPGCKQPYIKDDHCEHVVCMNPKCKTSFCFTCSCLRSPTIEHGNHYHRPDCKWFFPLPEVEKANEKYLPDKCDECKRLGELCKPPMQLAVQRKFAPGEI
ncbi:unnamed protein product [Blepharisma stoltei]|uniref:RING-type domain-containing protein n=1 Tax=Blepharisma stoltei TaxID=1481888 RepID=A0AAU9I849_9CILI|nr:unnamed protein product [Blepharisma stoltei]